MALGVLSDDLWCAALVGAAVGGAMEMKDKQWGGKADVVDAACTFVGSLAGFAIKCGMELLTS